METRGSHDRDTTPASAGPANALDGRRAAVRATAALQFHVISFEGPDAYSRAGGIASRVSGLTRALADAGYDTHLWFIGAPDLPGYEEHGRLTWHRWCQWISQYHPAGVYAGEEGKRADLAASLPPYLFERVLLPHLRRGGRAVILAEEWQTVDAVLHLDWLLRGAGVREQVALFWNANNIFGFERIDWPRLANAARILTVSRYMRYRMWAWGIDPTVMPNGLSADDLLPPDRAAVNEMRQCVQQRMVLSKVARWDPDKNWLLTIDTVSELKRLGWRPLLIARGGVQAHHREVLEKAASRGLRVAERSSRSPGARGLLDCLQHLDRVDVVDLRSPLQGEARRVLFRGSAAVLANSGHEPFGLVGLEAMAAGGLACTGATGEDYAMPGRNAVVLQSQDPREFVSMFQRLRAAPGEERALRRRGRATAAQYAWSEIVARVLLPWLRAVAG